MSGRIKIRPWARGALAAAMEGAEEEEAEEEEEEEEEEVAEESMEADTAAVAENAFVGAGGGTARKA